MSRGGGGVATGGFGGSTDTATGGSAAGIFGANVGGFTRTGFGGSEAGVKATTAFGGNGGNDRGGGGTDRLGSAFGRSFSDAGSVPGASVHGFGFGAASAGRWS